MVDTLVVVVMVVNSIKNVDSELIRHTVGVRMNSGRYQAHHAIGRLHSSDGTFLL